MKTAEFETHQDLVICGGTHVREVKVELGGHGFILMDESVN